ncbi:hypothetical protein MRX96_054301 [Rhipicephalus microplus]
MLLRVGAPEARRSSGIAARNGVGEERREAPLETSIALKRAAVGGPGRRKQEVTGTAQNRGSQAGAPTRPHDSAGCFAVIATSVPVLSTVCRCQQERGLCAWLQPCVAASRRDGS